VSLNVFVSLEPRMVPLVIAEDSTAPVVRALPTFVFLLLNIYPVIPPRIIATTRKINRFFVKRVLAVSELTGAF